LTCIAYFSWEGKYKFISPPPLAKAKNEMNASTSGLFQEWTMIFCSTSQLLTCVASPSGSMTLDVFKEKENSNILLSAI
jgi:hypothetical protein